MDLTMSCSSLSLLFFISLHIHLLVPASGKFLPFQECAPFDCGEQQISYPFRLKDQPSYCGYPGYELGCDGYNPTLSMESLKYRVVHMNMSTQILEVTRMDLSEDVCHGAYVNTTLNSSLFYYAFNYFNFALFYECNSSQPPQHYIPFSCVSSGDGYFALDVDLENPLHEQCKFSVLVPISHGEDPGLTPPPEDSAPISRADISKFLNEGFEITWIADTSQCESCTRSGGRCGYDWKSPHRPTLLLCDGDDHVHYTKCCHSYNGGTIKNITYIWGGGRPQLCELPGFKSTSGYFKPFQDCVPYRCRDQEINYPFRHNKQPNHCGYPGYELGCDGDSLTLSMESLEYRVIHMDRRAQILEVVRTDLMKDICLQTYVNTTLNCNGYFAPDVDLAYPLHNLCNFSIRVPIPKEALFLLPPPWESGDHGANISEVLNEGFEITWIANTSQCKSCTRSGGDNSIVSALMEPIHRTATEREFQEASLRVCMLYSHLVRGFQLAKAVQLDGFAGHTLPFAC
ncbi:hypothetical protein BT93_B0559 [Corymbia citriodora subsp. variegata]|nr:hypothetical protein BT93_B0559 [Corymbia citriodora subsp. variegata]